MYLLLHAHTHTQSCYLVWIQLYPSVELLLLGELLLDKIIKENVLISTLKLEETLISVLQLFIPM